MVQAGQYLERMAVIPAGAEVLEGLYHRGDLPPPVVLVPPHPRDGGSMDAAVVAEGAFAITRAGHATLRFNFRGVGASSGTPGGPAEDLADVEAAVVHLAATTAAARLDLCAFAGAAPAALRAAASPGIGAVALVAPSGDGLAGAAAFLAGAAGARAPVTVLLVGPGAAARSALAALGDRCRFETVPDADLATGRGLPEIGRRLVAAVSSRRRDR